MPGLLRGPIDPDIFRTKRSGARWYRDPLPADHKWPEMTDAVPAVTTIKKAWSKPWRKKTPSGLVVPLDAYRAAAYVSENIAQLAAMHPEQAFTMVATAPERDLARAGDRGTGVHSVVEGLAAGIRLAPELHDDDVRPFIPACELFVEEWSPRWRMTEFVVINRTLGFAGTADALVEFPDAICPTCDEPYGLTIVDWKSRGSAHGAYPEEVCQLGGYASGEYVVITNEQGDLERVDPPEVQHGAIVSITADDGYRLYPVEIADARHAFLGLFETWRIRRDGESVARKAVGLPAPRPTRAVIDHESEQVARSVDEPQTDQHVDKPVLLVGEDVSGDNDDDPDTRGDVPNAVNEMAEPGTDFDFVGHARSRVALIVETAAGRPLPIGWPVGVPTFKSGDVEPEHLPAIEQWCWDMEGLYGLPFPPEKPDEDDQPPQPEQDDRPKPRPNPKAEAEGWATKGRALLSLLDDDVLAHKCAETARCAAAVMSREHYLALQAVVTQVSAPAGVIVAHWSGSGVDIRGVKDMEKALLAAMPTTGTVTKATKLEALRRGKRVAKRLGVKVPVTYDDLCGDVLLAACVAVGHGVNAA